MDRREALGILQELLDSFPDDEGLRDLEAAPAGPGYRFYTSGRFSDEFIRNAREALAILRRDG